jgi:ParB-like chromosome segregation protein Spo0J
MTTELDVYAELVSVSSTDDVCSNPVDIVDQLPVFRLPLSSLRPGFFLRQSGTDAAHVQLLADVASSVELPAILVQKSSLRIVDGMHRIEAAKLRGEESIDARFVDCSDDEAFMLAVKSNTLHGLPLSRADRIAGAKRILEGHGDWSDRAVAAATGMSAKTIASLRHYSDGETKDLDKRLGRDGKWRPVTGTEGRKRAADYLAIRPDASVREVAREADVSLGTVHDVRAKLRRGLDPTAVRRRSYQDRAANGSAADKAGRDWLSPRNGNGPHPRRPSSLAPPWSDISPKLASDPTIRYTENGRNFLRWMATRIMQPGEWKEFAEAVPTHWTKDISLVAESVSSAWLDFADQLRTRQSPAV